MQSVVLIQYVERFIIDLQDSGYSGFEDYWFQFFIVVQTDEVDLGLFDIKHVMITFFFELLFYQDHLIAPERLTLDKTGFKDRLFNLNIVNHLFTHQYLVHQHDTDFVLDDFDVHYLAFYFQMTTDSIYYRVVNVQSIISTIVHASSFKPDLVYWFFIVHNLRRQQLLAFIVPNVYPVLIVFKTHA